MVWQQHLEQHMITQEWGNIPLPQFQQLVFSFHPFAVMLKEEWMLQCGKHGPVPTFWELGL